MQPNSRGSGYWGVLVSGLSLERRNILYELDHELVDGRKYLCQNCVRLVDKRTLPSLDQEEDEAGMRAVQCVVA